jgi:hypothetical protein
MSRRFLPALIAAIALVSVFASTAAATHSWNNYHWARTANPFTLKVGDNVDASWDSYLGVAISDWSRSTVMDLTSVPGLATNKRCKPTSGRIEVCNGSYGNNGWLGLAQIWLSNGHISQGTAKMNDTYFNSPTYNTPDERQHVICQEVGHDFGLGHQDESGLSLGTCMDYSSDPRSTHPNQHDYDQLVTIYSHLDSYTTIGASAGATLAEKDDAKAAKVDRVDHVKDSTIVEHFSDGSKRITHIYWATPFG